MLVMSQILAVLLSVSPVALLHLGAGAPARQGKAELVQRSESEKCADELKAEMGAVVKQYANLLKDSRLSYATTHFGLAEQAVKTIVVDGKTYGASIGEFHYGLSAFLRGIEEVRLGASRRADRAQLSALATALQAIQKKANRCVPLRTIEQVEFDASTTLDEAAEYGSRAMNTIRRSLYEGTTQQVTGEGKEKTDKVMKAHFERLASALAALDAPGQADQDASTLHEARTQAILAAKQRIVEFRNALPELVRYHSWAEPRVKLVEPILKVLEANLGKLRVPKS